MRHNTLLGIIAGLAIGLFLDALLLYLTNSWIVIFVIPVVLPPVLCGIIGAFIARTLPPISDWYLIPVCILGAALVLAPWAVINWRLTSVADSMPIPPGAVLTKRMVVESCSDNDTPWVDSRYTSDVPPAQVKSFVEQSFGIDWEQMDDYERRQTFRHISGDRYVSYEERIDAEGSIVEVYVGIREFCGRR